jgi:ComF family protein
MKNVLFSFLDFFLPQYCAGCSKKLDVSEPQVCDDCFSDLLIADTNRIEIEFERKFEKTGYIQDFFSPYVFESEGTIHNIIHSIKYNRRFRVGVLLGNKLAEALLGKISSWKIDIVIPVPLHHLKKAERGFNQSEFIVRGLRDSSTIPYSTNIIKRIRFTESQTKLNMRQREENVAGAFKVSRKKKVVNKNILLVDDVITTGATVNECAKVLIENGVNEVYASSVAIAD